MQYTTKEYDKNINSVRSMLAKGVPFQEIRYQPAQILRTKGLLETEFPFEDYQAFFERDAAVIAQDLIDIDFEFDLDMWMLIEEKSPECVNALLSNLYYRQAVQRKVLFIMSAFEEVPNAYIEFLCKVFSIEFFSENSLRKFMQQLRHHVEVEFLLALDRQRKYNLVYRILTCSETSESFREDFLWALNLGMFIDFNRDHIDKLRRIKFSVDLSDWLRKIYALPFNS